MGRNAGERWEKQLVLGKPREIWSHVTIIYNISLISFAENLTYDEKVNF